MAYRNGTYIAFDGLGQTNPKLSDFKYYAIIEAWSSHESIDFNYINSHDKTYAVRDTSSKNTLESRIRERLSSSKNVVVILSSDTRNSGSMLDYEIEQAVDRYKLPLIITYVDYNIIANPEQLYSYWPSVLHMRISNKTAKAIHIPFIKEPLLDAIKKFNNVNLPSSSLNYYSKEAHQKFGCLNSSLPFLNSKK